MAKSEKQDSGIKLNVCVKKIVERTTQSEGETKTVYSLKLKSDETGETVVVTSDHEFEGYLVGQGIVVTLKNPQTKLID